MNDSLIQITIYELRHFTLMTELLNFTIDFAFLCKPVWGYATVSPFPLSWGRSSK